MVKVLKTGDSHEKVEVVIIAQAIDVSDCNEHKGRHVERAVSATSPWQANRLQ